MDGIPQHDGAEEPTPIVGRPVRAGRQFTAAEHETELRHAERSWPVPIRGLLTTIPHWLLLP